jgi:hypothetical protein
MNTGWPEIHVIGCLHTSLLYAPKGGRALRMGLTNFAVSVTELV